ncbi:MAG: cobaltochelatase subunit CobN [Methanimicrococcus sp.]|nr:cobaltochelatase subunit CobN [Methanimicrococcus sp.]
MDPNSVELFPTINPRFVGGPYYSNLNYNYIQWTGGADGSSSDALKTFASSAAVADQDVIIFDMYYANDMDDIYKQIAENKSENTQIIGARGAADSLDIFTHKSDDILDDLLTTRYNATNLITSPDIKGMNFVFQSYLLEAFVSPDKTKDMNVNRMNILYVGFTIPEPEDCYAGTFMFDFFETTLKRTPYRHYFNKFDSVSYGNSISSNILENGEDTTWYSLENLESNMTDINLDDYDIVILDGLYTEEMHQEFKPFVEKIIEKDTVILFNTDIKNGVIWGIPSWSSAPYNNLLFNRYGLAFYKPFVSGSLDYNGKDTISGVFQFINLNKATFKTQLPYAFKGFSAPTKNSMTFPEGDIFHPIAGEYFKTVADYKKWHETSFYCQRDSDGNVMPYIGIFGFTSYVPVMKEFTPIIESKGYNVVCAASVSTVSYYDHMDKFFIDINGDPHVECLISMKNWALNYGDQPEGVRQLEEIGVPVIKVVGGISNGPYDINSGVSENDFMWMASSSNVDGMIDFIASATENFEWIADRAISYANLRTTPNPSKEIAIMYYNYPPGKDDIGANYLNVMRSLAGDGAKARVAAGDPLIPITNPESTGGYAGLLRILYDEGYNVSLSHLPVVTIEEGGEHSFEYGQEDYLILNEENLIHLVYSQGINVGAYAPGVLNTMIQERVDYIHDDNPAHTAENWWGCELIPVIDYLEWLEHETTPKEQGGNGTMASALYDELIQTWGTPTYDGAIPTSDDEFEAWGGMIWKDEKGDINPLAPGLNYIVVPMIKFGDIRLMPEPNRALAGDKALDSGIYHSGDLPPTHQYVATYMWLNRGTGGSTGSGTTGILGGDNGWKADALVHFGTHGTQEWLPGYSVGLRRTADWGPVLLPDLPNIYPYIVANVGEGLTAEYRGNALILSHMTPPMIKTKAYDSIIDMETSIRGYQKQKSVGDGGNEAILSAYRQIILEDVYNMGWQNAFQDIFSSYKQDIAKEKKIAVDKVTDKMVQDYLYENPKIFDVFLENHLHTFVESIRENSLSYGTHVYGAFDENQIAAMVWNMWSRQGLDDVLLDTYFDDVPSIPTQPASKLNEIFGDNYEEDDFNSKYTEEEILDFVTLLANSGTTNTDTIRGYLQATFNKETGPVKAKEDKILLFLTGPSGYLSDSSVLNANGASTPHEKAQNVVSAWKNAGIYDDFEYQLFQFYFYSKIPQDLRTETERAGFRTVGPKLDGDGKEMKDENGNVLTTSYYLDKDKMEQRMIQFAEDVITEAGGSHPSYKTAEKYLNKNFEGKGTDRSWYNDRMVYYFLGNGKLDYAANLKATGDSEIEAFLTALSFGYVSPSSGNDPVLNPHVLPTGRNFYGVDPSTYSTPAAWRVGQAMGEQMLISYYNTNGEFPSTVSFMRFGVDYIQDEGTLEACLFYLLGCEPKWDATGVFLRANPVTQGDVNYDDLFRLKFTDKNGVSVEIYRPRVDIVYNSAGMRDGYGSMLRHIDTAVKTVASLSESDDNAQVFNHIKKNVDDLMDIMSEYGITGSNAWELATSRTFAQQLGQYEIGTGNLVSASGNLPTLPKNPTAEEIAEYQKKLKEITDTYLKNMGFLFTNENWGGDSEAITRLLQTLLGRTDASLFASAGNLYDSVDNDDVFQYFGIMNMVSMTYGEDGKYLTDMKDWKTPQMFIADTSNIHNYKAGKKVVYTASEYVQKDLAARYLNPDWVKGQMEAGYSGAALMSEFIENIYGWSIATNGDLIGQETWNKIFEMYGNNSTVTNWLSNTSPYALQSSSGRLLEAIRTGMWDASDAQIKTLMQNYVNSVLETGMACCHHTCGNPTLDSFIAGQISVLGLSPDQEEKYWQLVQNTTDREKPETPAPEPSGPSSKSSGSGYGQATTLSGPSDGDNSVNDDEGEENADQGESPGVGVDGDVSGVPVTEVTGFEMTVKNMANSVRNFISNPQFSSSSIIAIAFVVIVVGAIFYGSRKRGL